jgi:chemotaxis family two-component system response regulator Rcp1
MSLMLTNVSWQLLLIEDDADDISSTRRAFWQADRSARLHVVCDGIDAMAFLQRQGVHGGAPRPDLILLDLSLPKLDGREVLARIKLDDSLKSIPTIILTASETGADVAQCYRLQANAYLTKPDNPDAFAILLKNMIKFWLTAAKLPHTTITDGA